MKLILGDNQFFGVNHFDFEKGEETASQFRDLRSIKNFIESSLDLGMDGFMINSNAMGYRLMSEGIMTEVIKNKETHYSIPYPHKYASYVNDGGLLSLLKFVLKNARVGDIFRIIKFMINGNIRNVMPILLRFEIPKGLKKGSIVYLQNVVTDLLLGLKGGERIILSYVDMIVKLGYKPGVITLNPGQFKHKMGKLLMDRDIVLCFNINMSGFNVFPSKSSVEKTILELKELTNWDLMGMSILSSGKRDVSIKDSFDYIKKLHLDYIVFGSSSLSHVESNLEYLK